MEPRYSWIRKPDDDYGIGGTGISNDDYGIGGTGIIGTISGFGSIIVNGLHIEYSQTKSWKAHWAIKQQPAFLLVIL